MSPGTLRMTELSPGVGGEGDALAPGRLGATVPGAQTVPDPQLRADGPVSGRISCTGMWRWRDSSKLAALTY